MMSYDGKRFRSVESYPLLSRPPYPYATAQKIAPAAPFSVLAGLAISACVGPIPPVSFQAPLGINSMVCAESHLAGLDYEVERTQEAVQGEVRIMSGDVGVTREFIRVTRVGSNRLEVSVEAFRVDPAMHSGPFNRQVAVKTSPTAETVRAAEDLVRACGRE